jgi:CarD family transcriptional regulator
MQFSVGDKVVHPYHGPGQVIGVEQKELSDESKRYYIIEIPLKGLKVYVPRRKADQVGVRLAVTRADLHYVWETLRAKPCFLPQDHKERQEQIWEKLKTGLLIQMAEVVRDLTWHEQREHLTKKDADYLDQGRNRLAAEIALASGTDVADTVQMVDDILAACLVTSQA